MVLDGIRRTLNILAHPRAGFDGTRGAQLTHRRIPFFSNIPHKNLDERGRSATLGEADLCRVEHQGSEISPHTFPPRHTKDCRAPVSVRGFGIEVGAQYLAKSAPGPSLTVMAP